MSAEGYMETEHTPPTAALPFVSGDYIAVDAKGYCWRVWRDESYWSMCPVNPDNSPIPQPVQFYAPVGEPVDVSPGKLSEALAGLLRPDTPSAAAQFDAVARALSMGGYASGSVACEAAEAVMDALGGLAVGSEPSPDKIVSSSEGWKVTGYDDGTLSVVQTDEWLTPPHITRALGQFDLDPCTTGGNWIGATRWYSLDADEDGLSLPWEGRVWLNPPYSDVAAWMRRMAEHDHGTALIFARTETAWWHAHIWRAASAILFLRGRLTFHYPDGSTPKANSGAPSALVAYGFDDGERLRDMGQANLGGAFIRPRVAS